MGEVGCNDVLRKIKKKRVCDEFYFILMKIYSRWWYKKNLSLFF